MPPKTSVGLFEPNKVMDRRAIHISEDCWARLRAFSGQRNEAKHHVARAIGHYNWTCGDGRRDYPKLFRSLAQLIKQSFQLEERLKSFLSDATAFVALRERASSDPPMNKTQIKTIKSELSKGLKNLSNLAGWLAVADQENEPQAKGPRDAAEKFLLLTLAEILTKFSPHKLSRSKKNYFSAPGMPRGERTVNTRRYLIEACKLTKRPIGPGTIDKFLKSWKREEREIANFEQATGVNWFKALESAAAEGLIEYRE